MQNMMNAIFNSWGLASMSTFEFPARNCCDWSCLERCWKRKQISGNPYVLRNGLFFLTVFWIFVILLLLQQFLLSHVSWCFFRDSWDLGESSSSTTILWGFHETGTLFLWFGTQRQLLISKKMFAEARAWAKNGQNGLGPKLLVDNI